MKLNKCLIARYPNLLTDIEQFIAPNPTNPSQQVIDDIELWWE